MPKDTLTVFYDGFCPLCVAEMNKLSQLDKNKSLKLVDIQQPEFAEHYPDLDWQALNFKIHGMFSNGELLQGLDVTYEAWRRVGHGWLYAPLRWPVIRFFADRAYLFFARHRYRISYLLTGQKRCDVCVPVRAESCQASESKGAK